MEKNLWSESQKAMITVGGDVKRYLHSDIIDKFPCWSCADISYPNGYNKANRVFEGYAPTIAVATIKEIIVKVEQTNKLRIRKLTPRECFRLQGVKDEDFEKIQHYPQSVLYHLSGDSICTNVLQELFSEMVE